MILACPFCRARFLVQASLFNAGPRQIKCARCKHEWLDDGSEEPKVKTPSGLFSEASKGPIEGQSAATGQQVSGGKEAAAQAAQQAAQQAVKKAGAYLDLVIVAVKTLPPMPPLSSIPPKILNIIKWGGIAFAVIAFLATFVLARESISNQIDFLEDFYNAIGLRVYHYGGAGLVFQNTRSELRYDSGITKLNVTGKIHNSTKKTQEMPDIMATASGADGKPIQSWQIDAPTVRLRPGEDVEFQSSINAPRATVVDISLSFIERKKDASE